MKKNEFLLIDGREIPIEGERNLLEIIRKSGIDLPTFCFHSELSIYGACRLCLVEVEGRGIQGACSTPPEPGMKVKTSTEEIRDIRRIAIELLLANGEHDCPTCPKSGSCQLQSLARRLGIKEVRFRSFGKKLPIDDSSLSLLRDPSKCVLCGDCVRVCSEIQGVGAIDFAHRGSSVAVLPAFGKELSQGECVNCGQCAAVCPTGALTPKSEVEDVWRVLDDKKKRVVAQIAPAVRVAIGEAFGMEPGEIAIGQIVTALRRMGFDRVFDTSFAADLTVMEETTEFLARMKTGERLPQFTSCCPAWVKYAEQYYPDLLPNLSSCRSPQQMFGSLAKEILPAQLNVETEDLIVVSIMPCTAKKFEARRPELDGSVDYVLTTQEVARMIEEAGLSFTDLQPDSLDLPLGFKTGAGVIFGSSGGVSEAVLRFAAEKITGIQLESVDFHAVRGFEGLREAKIYVGNKELKLAIVSGLQNAKTVADRVRSGEMVYDLIEVMACPGGCIGGAGQPVSRDPMARQKRCKGLYATDKMLQLHKSQENPYVKECYQQTLGEVGGEKAHKLLHTHYRSRRRIQGEELSLSSQPGCGKLEVKVCLGTSCFLKGGQDLLTTMARHVEAQNLEDRVEVMASFCFEKCDRGPSVTIAGRKIERCTLPMALEALEKALGESEKTFGVSEKLMEV